MNALIYNPTEHEIGKRLLLELSSYGHHASIAKDLPRQTYGTISRSTIFVIIDDQKQMTHFLGKAKLYQKDAFIIACLTKPIDDVLETAVDPFDIWILPHDFSVLRIKLQQLTNARLNVKEMYDLTKEVDYFQKRLQEEHVFADHVFKNQVNFDAMHDPAIRYWVNSSPNMHADLIAGARTPNGALHMLLADPHGQGLQAVVATLPLTGPFYAMTSKGLPLSEIAYELNRKAKTFLPTGYSVKATLVCVDSDKRTIEVWNGGNPAPVLLDANGRIVKRFISKHEPLGILESSAFDSMTEEYSYKMAGQLFAYTDGIRSIHQDNGTIFNESEFLKSLEGDDSYFRFSDAISYIVDKLKGERPEDDVAMFLVECPLLNDSTVSNFLPSSQIDIVRVQWKSSWTFHSEEIKYLNLSDIVLNIVHNVTELQSHYDNLKFILDELVLNAVDHGLLLMTAEDKHASRKMYNAVRNKKLKNLNHGTIEIGFEVQVQGNQKRVIIHVRDSGPGFNYRQMLGHAGTKPVEYTGEGIKEMKKRVELLEYMGNGNDVMVYYALDGHTLQLTKPVVIKNRTNRSNSPEK